MRRVTNAVFIGALLAILGLVGGSPAQAEADRNPVIFIHGFLGSSGDFSDMVANFRANGYSASQLYTMDYDDTRSNEETALQIWRLVDQVRQQTGAAKVDIVAHSMGSLSSRYFIKYLGGVNVVDEWVSIGGPNHGTNTAYSCALLNDSCAEMLAGSTFLTDLNRTDETPGAVRYGTFWSSCDEFINPDSSTPLYGATNTNVGCKEHFYLLHSAPVINSVRAFVRY